MRILPLKTDLIPAVRRGVVAEETRWLVAALDVDLTTKLTPSQRGSWERPAGCRCLSPPLSLTKGDT